MNKRHVCKYDTIIMKQNYTVVFEISTINIPQGENNRNIDVYNLSTMIIFYKDWFAIFSI